MRAIRTIGLLVVIAAAFAGGYVYKAIKGSPGAPGASGGGGGVSGDFPLASAWANARTLRLADGPDEVHREAIARYELAKWE